MQQALFQEPIKATPTIETAGFRPYQLEDFQSIRLNYEFGIPNQLIVHATGLGKTKMMAGMNLLLKEMGIPGQILILVHRQVLIQQTKAELESLNPNIRVAVEQGSNKSSGDYDVLIGSVQTLGTTKRDENGIPIFNKRILQIDPSNFAAVLVDETHRVSSPTFRSVIMYMGCYKGLKNYNPNRLLLGFTATPDRSDNQGMEEFYDTLAANRDLVWGIENNWLADLKAWRISTSVNLDDHDISVTSGDYGKDFSKKDLEKAVNIPARNKLVIENFLKYSEGYRGIFFCVDVQHAKDLCAMANSMGVPSRIVIGDMEMDERDRNLDDHKNDKYRCLMSVNALCEGYNDPKVVVACMCRPTKSRQFYIQAIGRIARPFPARESLAKMAAEGITPEWIKPYGIILDFCDTTSKHTIVTASSVFGLGSKYDFKGQSAIGEAKKVQQELCKLDEKQKSKIEDHQEDITSIEDLKAIVEKIDLLSPPALSHEAAKFSELEWVSVNGKHEISLPGNEVIMLKMDTIGCYDIIRSIKGNRKIEHSEASLEKAVKWAEKNCINDGDYDLLRANAKWKVQRPSNEQSEYLMKLRPDLLKKFTGNKEQCHQWIRSNYDKGTVSRLISEAKEKRGW